MLISYVFVFFFSSRRRHTRCALVTGVQTCALPICITPVGRWPLRRVLYRADRIARPVTVLPCQPIAPDDGWCDDPADPAYNRPVRLPYPARHERLTRDDHLYDLVVVRSEEPTSDLQSLMRLSYAVFCLQKKNKH